jgi:hypothetical protein
MQFGDATLWPDSPPEVAAAAPPGAVLASARDLCIGTGCEFIQPETDTEPCLEALTLDTCVDGECDTIDVQPLVDPASAELDDAASARSAEMLGEQMWVNYYASAGEVSEEVRLLNDAVTGFNTDTATEYEAADEPRVSYVWAVAHDNRGGTEWARVRVCTRCVNAERIRVERARTRPLSARSARSERRSADRRVRDVFLPAVVAVYDLVAVCRGRCDEGALLARFLLGLTVAGLCGRVVRRSRQVLPTRSSCQKCNRAAAANEAAHLSKYKRMLESRQRPPGDSGV